MNTLSKVPNNAVIISTYTSEAFINCTELKVMTETETRSLERAQTMEDKDYKDPELEGFYVKRCKCGRRPYYDRIAIIPTSKWIACNCGKTGKSDLDKQKAIDNWNNDILE